MPIELKLRKIGNSGGVAIPKEALGHLKVEKCQSLYLTEGPEGSYRIATSDPEFTKSMAMFEDLSRRYRNTLRELAK